jgi:hypothetical protein
MSHPFPFRKVYGPGTILAAVTFCGLLSALLGDGIWDAVSWCALTIPLAVIVWKYGQSMRTRFRGEIVSQPRPQEKQ